MGIGVKVILVVMDGMIEMIMFTFMCSVMTAMIGIVYMMFVIVVVMIGVFVVRAYVEYAANPQEIRSHIVISECEYMRDAPIRYPQELPEIDMRSLHLFHPALDSDEHEESDSNSRQ